MYHALQLDDIETAKVLVKYGANVNAISDDEITPLILALRAASEWMYNTDAQELVDMLLARGATKEGKNEEEELDQDEDDTKQGAAEEDTVVGVKRKRN